MYNPDEDYQVMLAKLKTICQNKNIKMCIRDRFQTLTGIQSLSGFGQGSGKETRKPDGV